MAREPKPTAYANRRAEMWDNLRQWFDDPAGVQIPDSDELQGTCAASFVGRARPSSIPRDSLFLSRRNMSKNALPLALILRTLRR